MSTRALRRGNIARSGALAPSTVNVLSLPGTAGNYVSTPDSVANSITGDIDIRAKIAMDDWTPALTASVAAKWAAAGSRSWRFYVDDLTGMLRLDTSVNGTNTSSTAISTVGVGFTDGTDHWIRATRRVSDGRVQFFTSADGISWIQLGTDVSTTVNGHFNGTGIIEIGTITTGTSQLWAGSVYYAELRDGIDGTIVQFFDAMAVTKIGTRDPSTVAAGGPWTINGTAWDWVAV